MAATSPCVPCCPTIQVVNIPGIQGLSYVAGVSQTRYGSGVAFAVTTTPQLLNMGTNPPSITLPDTRIYAIFARARFDWVAATPGAVYTLTVKLRRINNTAADLLTLAYALPSVTAASYTAAILSLPPWIYTPAQAGDNIELWGSLSNAITTLNTIDTALVAIPIG